MGRGIGPSKICRLIRKAGLPIDVSLRKPAMLDIHAVKQRRKPHACGCDGTAAGFAAGFIGKGPRDGGQRDQTGQECATKEHGGSFRA
jgi:hypothetical protein